MSSFLTGPGHAVSSVLVPFEDVAGVLREFLLTG